MGAQMKFNHIIIVLLGCGFSIILSACAFHKAEFGASGIGGQPQPSVQHPLAEKIVNNHIKYNYKSSEIQKLCADKLAAVQLELAAGVGSAFHLEVLLADLSDTLGPLIFMAYVNKTKEVRDEASQCEENYNKFTVDVYTRRDLYTAVRKTKTKTTSQRRLVAEMRRQFEANGMALSDEKLQEFKKLKSQLAELETQFAKNLNEDNSQVEFNEAQLAGVPADFVKRLKRTQNGRYIVTTKSTDFLQVMENAQRPETRQQLLLAYDNRAGEANTQLLQSAIILRQQMAGLMGYKTWADYRIEGRMAKNSKNALELLLDLKSRLRPRLEADLNILIQAKKQMEDQSATDLKSWDVRYYINQVKKRDYSLDDEVIREYFPRDVVMRGVFDIYSTLLGVNYEEVQNAPVWADDVKLYAVREKKSNVIVAYFYADLVPRQGKFGHAAAFPLISGRVLPEGYYSQPVAAIVANFTPPTADKPALFTHREVETLFHEFGHIMHQILTRAPYAYLSGTSVAQDFVEAPSQMLEAWVWDAEMLNKISGHYKDTTKKLPATLVEKMLLSKDFNQGYHYSRQIMLGLNDMTMHTASGVVDVTEVYRRTHEDVLLFSPIAGSRFNAGFGHLMGGYDAGYYGYIWSEVYADDMLTKFEKDGLLNSETGRSYLDNILAPGNMRDPLELVTQFLGRRPNNEAFLKKLGL